MATGRILIDLRAPAARIDGGEFRAWASDQRVFISSVMTDLRLERKAVADAVASVGAEPIWFEKFGGRDADPEAAYLTEVAKSSIFVGLLGRLYGTMHRSSRLSATHEEYRHAETCGLRICVWTAADGEFVASQQAFVQEVRTFHVTGSFKTPVDLAASVEGRMRGIAAEELSPWCKLDGVVFRATAIRDSGKEIEIDATVHDHAVVAALEAMRPDILRDVVWGGTRKLSYSGRSRPVDVRNVVTKISAARSTGVFLTVAPCPVSADRPSSISWSEYSTDDLIEINIRKALFAETGPAWVGIIGGGLGDPLGIVRSSAIPEDTIRPLINLGLTEALVGTDQVARVTKVLLSQELDGMRELLIEWQPRGTAASRTVRGHVRL